MTKCEMCGEQFAPESMVNGVCSYCQEDLNVDMEANKLEVD